MLPASVVGVADGDVIGACVVASVVGSLTVDNVIAVETGVVRESFVGRDAFDSIVDGCSVVESVTF